MLTANFIDESEVQLEFGNGQRDVDIRFGILKYGVLDLGNRVDPRTIRIGIVGTSELIDQFLGWLEECGHGVDAKESDHPNLFPRFPGFGSDSQFFAEWTCDDRSKRVLSPPCIAELSVHQSPGAIVNAAVELYLREIRYLAEEVRPEIVFCIVPDSISDHLDRACANAAPVGRGPENEDEDDLDVQYRRHDFHHCLKAAAMPYRIALQLVLPSTFGAGFRKKPRKARRPNRESRPRALQDPATRAWNLFTAMYYKAGASPWRLPRESTDYSTCYIGISYYASIDQQSMLTSIAQMFNERGEGIVVRGGQARLSKEDRSPHLTSTDMARILDQAISRYRAEHKTSPARVVIHKSSYFDDQEVEGAESAIQASQISMMDLISIRKSRIRLFRLGAYPVLRGTHIRLDGQSELLYTRGSVPFYETYPGMYAPRALDVQLDSVEQSRDVLCREILALTKMNWNSTQFDMRDPITIHASRAVGNILKYVPSDTPADQLASRYSFYM